MWHPPHGTLTEPPDGSKDGGCSSTLQSRRIKAEARGLAPPPKMRTAPVLSAIR